MNPLRTLLPLLLVAGLLGLVPSAAHAADSGVSVSWDEPTGSHHDQGVRFHLETDGSLLPSSWFQVVGGARTYYSGSPSVTVTAEATGPMTVRWHVETLEGSVTDGEAEFLVDATRPVVRWNSPAPPCRVTLSTPPPSGSTRSGRSASTPAASAARRG